MKFQLESEQEAYERLQQPNADMELSIENGEDVQLNVPEDEPEIRQEVAEEEPKVKAEVAEVEAEELLEAPRERGEGDGIEYDPATGEYVHFDKFYMSAPEEWAERYRIRTGQEPSEAQMQAVYSLGDTPAGWSGIRQEMAEQQERMKYRLESEQEAYERQQAEALGQKEAVHAEQPKNEYVPISVAEPTRTNPVLEAPDQLIQRLNQEFPGRVTENMQKNIMAMHEKACDSYDTLEKACASQPKGENKGISGKEQVRDVLRYDYLSQSLNAGVMDEKDLVMLNSNSYQAIDNKIMDGASRSVGFYQNPQKPEVFRHGIMSRSGLDRVTDVYMQEKKGVLSNPELGNAGKFKSYVENYEKKALQQNEPARKRARTATKTDVKKMETHRRASVSGMGMH